VDTITHGIAGALIGKAVFRGRSRDVKKLADRLISTKGVRHGRLVMSSPEVVSRRSHPHQDHHHH